MRLNPLLTGIVFFQHSGLGILFVFLPVLGSGLADSIYDVGIMVAAFYLSELVSAWYFGRASDRRGDRVTFIRAGFAVCTATFGMSYFITDPLHLLLAMIGTGAAAGVMTPAIFAYVYEYQQKKRGTAWVISFHTLGWIAGILAAGMIGVPSHIFLAVSAMFAAGFVISLSLPKLPVTYNAGTSLLVFRQNLHVYVPLLLRHTGASAIYTVLPLFLLGLGATILEISLMYVMQMSVSTAVMMLLSKYNLDNRTAFVSGIMLSTVALSGMLFAAHSMHMLPFMFLLGISGALVYIGGTLRLLPDNPKSTSMGIFHSMIALGWVGGPVAAGMISLVYGHAAVTWFMLLLVVCALALSLASTGLKTK